MGLFGAGRGARANGRAAAILAVVVGALAIGIAVPAQAHTPYTAVAWGQGSEGTLGNGENQSHDVPVAVKNLSGVTEIASEHGSAFYGQALARLEGGTVWGWGRNDFGQVGDASTSNKNAPVAVCAVGSTEEQCQQGAHLSGVKSLAAGARHSLALLEGGTVVEWGRPGDGSATTVPVAKAGLSGVRAIAAGQEYSLALLENGTVMAWGVNESGRLGNGTETPSAEPVAVCAVGDKAPCATDLSHVKAIAAGTSHSLALLENGTVVAWGSNSLGKLGDGNETTSSVPVVVCAIGVVSPCSEESKQLKESAGVAAGEDDSLALLASGRVVSWGTNSQGALGDGGNPQFFPEHCPEPTSFGTCSRTPVPVCAPGYSESKPCSSGPYLSGVTQIARAGETGSAGYALLESGNILAWGKGGEHDLGDGTTESHEVPVYVCAPGEKEKEAKTEPTPCANDLTDVKGIAGGDEQGFAFGPPPAVTRMLTKSGPASGGVSVFIEGTDFAGTKEVKFGSVSALSFELSTPAVIRAVAPAETAGKVDVKVTNQWGMSATSTSDLYTFYPTVTGVSPNKGPTAGGTTVTVKGSGFMTGTKGTIIKFAGTKSASINCSSTSECTAVSPKHLAATVDVRAIVNGITSPRNRPADLFTYE